MGIRIQCDDESAAPPRPISVFLVCDGDGHGMFPADVAIFRHPEGFVGCHKLAMGAGWLERDGGARGRLWLGPCCSGKEPSRKAAIGSPPITPA
jgi:hypothetical protein